MKVIKNINNNVALCVDSAGKELIAVGRGIGFHKPPYEIDAASIERTYYNLDNRYVGLLETIDESIFDVAVDIRRIAEQHEIATNQQLVFTLADHIQSAFKRLEDGITFQLPIEHDIKNLFPREMEVGREALALIEKRLGKKMPAEEATYIAINILNAEQERNRKWHVDGQLIDEILTIISEEMQIDIDKESFSYSRFVSHLRYLLDRSDREAPDEARELLASIIKTNPREYQTALAVKRKIDAELSRTLPNVEVVYLSLHINRLCDRREN